MPDLRFAAAIAACAVLFFAGWTVNGWRMGENIVSIQAEHAKERDELQSRINHANDAARSAQLALSEQIQVINDENQKLQDDLARARDDVSTGRRVVYVKATCPTVSGADSYSPAGDPGRAARLDADSGQRYMAFRSAYAEQLRALKVCRAYAQKVMDLEKEKAR